VLKETAPLRLDGGRPVVSSGIGTSRHAARVAATWVTDLSRGRVRVAAIDAHAFALREPLQGNQQVIVISHRAYERYPREALRRARASGARTNSYRRARCAGPRRGRRRPHLRERIGRNLHGFKFGLVGGARPTGIFVRCKRRVLGALEHAPQLLDEVLASAPPVEAAASARGVDVPGTEKGRCFVPSCNQYARRSDYPADYAALGDNPERVVTPGGRAIVGPLGDIVAGPDYEGEAIRVADVVLAETLRGKFDFDIAGHYSRPDLFTLRVDRRPQEAVTHERASPTSLPLDAA
jgi:hypothetical protein